MRIGYLCVSCVVFDQSVLRMDATQVINVNPALSILGKKVPSG